MTDKNKNKEKDIAKSTGNEENEKNQGFWDEAKENISEGARFIGEEAKNIGERVSTYSEVLFGKIKEKTSDALKYGLDLTEEGVSKAQELGEQFRDNFQINKLNTEKKRLSAQLGMKFYLAVKENNNHVPRDLISDEAIFSLLKDIEEIDKEILKLSEEEK